MNRAVRRSLEPEENDEPGLLENIVVGSSLKEAFDRDNGQKILRGTRLGLQFAILLFPIFALLDLFYVPAAALHPVLWVRAGAEVVLIFLVVLTLRPWAQRNPVPMGLIAIYLTGLSLEIMTLLFEPGVNPYYAGVNLVLVGAIIIPWGLMPSVIAGASLWLTYLLSHIITTSVSHDAIRTFIGNNFFMASTAILASGVTWYAHNLRYDAFRARYKQMRANNELHIANEQLSRQHREMQQNRDELATAKSALEDINAKLEEQYQEVQQKREELEKATKELGEINAKLEEQFRVKSQFLDNMNHEMRTPLTCILTPLEALLAGDVSGQPRRYLEMMRTAGQQLYELINDLLDLSRYENKQMPLHREKFDPAERVRELAEMWTFIAMQKQLDVQVIAPGDLPAIWVDRKEASKVVRNLMSNAVKFTPPGGRITVRLSIVDDMFEIAVSDTGPGIPAELLPKIGTPFFQVDASHTRQHEGTGLGLALVRNIMERHEGSFVADSVLGEGTTITVRFPLYVPPEGEEEEVASKPALEIRPVNVEEWNQAFGPGERHEELAVPRHMAEALPGMNLKPSILVVEDNPHLVELLVDILSPLYEVFTAGDGREGLEKIHAHKPQLVLSDVMMPHMTGTELLQIVRRDPELDRLPFVLLTAKAEGQDRVQGLWAGANDYVTKPFNPQELLARISNLLRVREFETYLTQLNEQLAGKSETLEGKLHRLFVNTVRTLVAAIDAKDYYTGGHSERVAWFSMILAEPFNLSPARMQTLELGALLHDVGKIGVPDRVLNKPGELTPEEVLIIREHPVNSEKILEKAPELTELRWIAVQHHERWDGKGYPYGLKGAESSLLARIVGMADCWDAMVSDRVYRLGMDPEVAVSKIRKMAGTQIDPAVVEALCQVYPKMSPLPPHLRPLKPRRPPAENRDPQVGLVE